METCDDSNSSEDNSEEEKVNMELMANTEASESESESDPDSKELFSHLNHFELELSLVKIIENSKRLHKRYKYLKQIHIIYYGFHSELIKERF